MAQKKVWMTWLPTGEGAPGPNETVSALSRVGLNVAGSLWVDDLEKAAWVELGGLLLEPNKADLWLIAGRRSDFESARNRYGLSLVTAMVNDAREAPLPALCVGLDFTPDAASLPMLMRQFQCLNGTEPAWPAKVVAAAFVKTGEPSSSEFRFNVIAHPILGQWFEVGPRDNEWRGVMFGVDGEANHYPTCRGTTWTVTREIGAGVSDTGNQGRARGERIYRLVGAKYARAGGFLLPQGGGFPQRGDYRCPPDE